MSLYEVLALAGLVAAGLYAFFLSRKDTRSPGPRDGNTTAGSLMFERPSRDRPRDSSGSGRRG